MAKTKKKEGMLASIGKSALHAAGTHVREQISSHISNAKRVAVQRIRRLIFTSVGAALLLAAALFALVDYLHWSRTIAFAAVGVAFLVVSGLLAWQDRA